MKNNTIQSVIKIIDSHVAKHLDDEAVFENNGLFLDVYDKKNLFGFKLTGNINNISNVYIVHDTDNYDRNNPSYKYMYDDVEKDIFHIAKQFKNGTIGSITTTKQGLFRKKQIDMITIPNQSGEVNEYKPMTVNSTNFFE